MVSINQSQWMVYKQSIKLQANVHKMSIILNKSKEVRKGSILIDYVKLNVSPSLLEDTTEIHEI